MSITRKLDEILDRVRRALAQKIKFSKAGREMFTTAIVTVQNALVRPGQNESIAKARACNILSTTLTDPMSVSKPHASHNTL